MRIAHREARVIAKVRSEFDSEALTAARSADRMLEAAGMNWLDLLGIAQERGGSDLSAQLATAVEAASVLLAELKEARETIAELERAAGSGLGDAKKPTSTSISSSSSSAWAEVADHREFARQCLAQHKARKLYLNEFEREVVEDIAAAHGNLPPAQVPLFTRVKAAITRRTAGRKS